MGLKVTLEDVLQSQDGPFECWDTSLTAREITDLWKQGFLKLDPERQRGTDFSGKQVKDDKKIERWVEELIQDRAIFGQLSWNIRRGSGNQHEVTYNADDRTLSMAASAAYLPDSYHRHMAIVAATDSAERGSGFDPNRRFSVQIFNVPAENENEIFYWRNQEGQKADPTRSKWLKRAGTVKLAAQFVQDCPHLTGNNVDTVRDRISKRNPRLCAFNTLALAFEQFWGDYSENNKGRELEFMLTYWDALLKVLPELGTLNLKARQQTREKLLSDNALAVMAYVGLARTFFEENIPLNKLSRLAIPITTEKGRSLPFFSRENPLWQELGILVPAQKTGKLSIRNARQSREEMLKAIKGRVFDESLKTAA